MLDEFERLKQALSDRYAIEGEIGSGGMATVYLAEDQRHRRNVAVKVLRPELAAALGHERFLREIEIAAGLQHPHILPLYDSGEAAGFLYYVMPYVTGESLRARLTRERELPIAEAVRILRDVADALTHAHGEGVVHRDIKPDNVLLSGRHALVTDFGVAKAVSEATGREQLTTAGVALGTPAYMAPEQAAADPQIDHRADVYAFGALAYELLSGRPPFTGTTPQMVLSAHITEAPEPVTRHRTTVPLPLEQIVMRCLEKKPADRWQSIEDLVPHLEALTTPSAGVTPAQTAPVSAVRGRKRFAAATALTIVILGTLAAWYLLTPRGSVADNDLVAVSVFANQTGDPALAPMGRMASEEITNGLLRTGTVRVVSTESMVQFARAHTEEQETAGSDLNRQLADATGAGLVVSGSYYLDGDSLSFRAQVIDATVGQVERSIGPVAAARDDPRSAIAELSQRVMVAVGQRFNARLGDLPQALSVPRSFAAYQEYGAGMDAFLDRDFERAGRHFRAAVGIDSMYADALLYLAVNQWNLGRRSEADSLLRIVERDTDRLTPLQRAFVEMQRAWHDGDRRGAYEAVVRGVALAQSGNWAYQLAREATRVNRPREAVDVLSTLDPEGPDLSGWASYWGVLCVALHMLGEYDEELQAGRRAQELYPSSRGGIQIELRALAATGQIDADAPEFEAALERWSALGGRRSGIMEYTGQELLAHGHEQAARDILDRTLAWLHELPPDLAARPGYRADLAYTLYSLERWTEAQPVFEELYAQDPEDVGWLGYLGTLAARQGDRAKAQRISEQIDAMEQPYGAGNRTYWRACIAALLDDLPSAVSLLREAHEQGLGFSIQWHRDSDLDPLRDYPPFQELMRPKG